MVAANSGLVREILIKRRSRRADTERMRVLVFALLFIALPCAAEYRAFQLIIRNTGTGTERTVLTTLDHLQYAEYYPVGRAEIVEYGTSWRCRGRTGDFKRICPDPRAPAAAAPASAPK